MNNGTKKTTGNVVAKYLIGNTRVTIVDDCAAKTEAEKKEVLRRLGDFVAAHFPKEGFRDEPLKFDAPFVNIGADGDFDEYIRKRGST